jgi:serine/threonine protein kinase
MDLDLTLFNFSKNNLLKDNLSENNLSKLKNYSKDELKDILICSLLENFVEKNNIKNSKMIYDNLEQLGIVNKDYLNDDIKNIRNKIISSLDSNNKDNTKSRYQKDFISMGVIGEGAYGIVEKAYNIIDKHIYAIKKIYLDSFDTEVFRETIYLSKLEHKNIIRYYSSWLDFEDNEPILYIQMEFCDISLRDWLNNNKHVDDSIKKKLFIDIIEGICYIHSKGLIHRDIKPENILIKYEDNNLTAKICDFGLSKWIHNLENKSHFDTKKLTQETIDNILTKHIGTELYSSPEQLQGSKYTYKTDIYSIGILIIDMFFSYKNDKERIKLIKSLNKENKNINKNNKYSTIVSILCDINPDIRPDIHQIKNMIKL